jgi:hypothetical protein
MVDNCCLLLLIGYLIIIRNILWHFGTLQLELPLIILWHFRTAELSQLELYLLPTTYTTYRKTDVFIDITKVPVIPS